MYFWFVSFHLSHVLIGVSVSGRRPCFRRVSIALTEDVITRELSTYSLSGKDCWVIEALWLTALHFGHLGSAGSSLSCREDQLVTSYLVIPYPKGKWPSNYVYSFHYNLEFYFCKFILLLILYFLLYLFDSYSQGHIYQWGHRGYLDSNISLDFGMRRSFTRYWSLRLIVIYWFLDYLKIRLSNLHEGIFFGPLGVSRTNCKINIDVL